MLILTRKSQEGIHIGDDIRIVVVSVRSDGRVRLGISAPDGVRVDRDEVYHRIKSEGLKKITNGPLSCNIEIDPSLGNDGYAIVQ